MIGIKTEKYLNKYNWHPWIFAIYYVFYPFILNIQHLEIDATFKPLIFVFTGTLIFFTVTSLGFRDTTFASILTSLTLILFFSYPPIFQLTQVIGHFAIKGGNNFEQIRQLSIFGIVFLFLGTYLLLILAKRKSQNITMLLNIALNAASLLLIVIITGFAFTKLNDLRKSAEYQADWDRKVKEFAGNGVASSRPKRDIYLIVLDGYGSNEVLDQIYNYDNSWFEDELKALGFYIIPNAKTNYSQSRTSFSSFLNMQYLDDIAAKAGRQTVDAHPLINMIRNNVVTAALQDEGYEVINFPSGYEYTEGIRADHQVKTGIYLDNFAQSLLWDSVAYPFLHQSIYKWHRANIQNTMSGLADLRVYPSPKFVIAHIFAPHPPFVFDKDGRPITPPYSFSAIDADTLIEATNADYYQNHYREQLAYISKEILVSIKEIMANSDVQPVIVLMGDHGPGLTVSLTNSADTNNFERMHILNALYLPGIDSTIIPPDHTPVNTFRLIFDQYFGYDLPMLENRSYESSYLSPYDFKDVTELSDINKVTNK